MCAQGRGRLLPHRRGHEEGGALRKPGGLATAGLVGAHDAPLDPGHGRSLCGARLAIGVVFMLPRPGSRPSP